jgi:hypothetical protein
MPVLSWSVTWLPLLVEPSGSLFATAPAGQTESIFVSSTATSKPAPLRRLVAAATVLQVTAGMATFLP